MLFSYFIARAGVALEKLPLQFVRHGDLVAAVGRPAGAARTTPAQMLEFNAVLAAASKRATILPLRFGTSFRNEAAVVQLLAARAGELGAALERLDGRVEMTVRVRLEAGESAAARLAQIRERVEAQETWSEVRADRAGHRVVELAHLMARSQAAEYRRRLGGEDLEVSGPWPPVHFLPQFLRMPMQRATGSGTSRASGAGSAGRR